MKMPVRVRRSLCRGYLSCRHDLKRLTGEAQQVLVEGFGFVRELEMRVGRPAWSRPTRPYIQLAFFCRPRELGAGAPADRHIVDSLGAAVVAGDDIFRIGRETVLVEIESLDLTLGRDTQSEAF